MNLVISPYPMLSLITVNFAMTVEVLRIGKLSALH